MPCPLPADCLNEVFENLENDKPTLRSCLLVNRLWCKISVRILWRNIWSFRYSVTYSRRSEVASAILSTLISCLPNESKELLHKNEIFISTPTSKPPLFNYASFCKVLSINELGLIIIKNGTSITPLRFKDKDYLVVNELLKMFMNQISSLKALTYYTYYIPNSIPFIYFPGAKDCLSDLSELNCSSDIQLVPQICHNLRSLAIDFEIEVSDSLKELVSSQNNLKNLELSAYEGDGWADIIPSLTKHSNTLTKLHLYGDYIDRSPLSFVSSFLNIQEIKFSFDGMQFDDFRELQYVTFPKLQILKIPYQHPKTEHMTKFLEINGKNLQELYIDDNALDLSIAKFCPNLKKLFTMFNYDDLDILKTIFNSCQYLEGIVTWCGKGELSEKELLKAVAKHSRKNFYELKLHEPELFPEDLESFFISWNNRTSKKSLSLIIINYRNTLTSKEEEENMKIIEKYKNLGIVKKFETRDFNEEELYL